MIKPVLALLALLLLTHQLNLQSLDQQSQSVVANVEVTHSSTRQSLKISQFKQVSLLTVPDAYQFYEYSSGQCCLEAVFNYYQFPISPSPYREDYFLSPDDLDPDNFTTPQRLVLAAQRKLNNETNQTRRNAFGIILQQNMELSVLERALSLEIPVILLIGKQEGRSGSYIIAIGHDQANYYFEDPSTLGAVAYLPKKELGRYWQVYIQSQDRWASQVGIIIQLKNGRKRETVPTIRPLP